MVTFIDFNLFDVDVNVI